MYQSAHSPIEATPAHLLCVLALRNERTSPVAWAEHSRNAGLRIEGKVPKRETMRSLIDAWELSGDVVNTGQGVYVPVHAAFRAFEALEMHQLVSLSQRVLNGSRYAGSASIAQSLLRTSLVIGSEHGVQNALDRVTRSYSYIAKTGIGEWLLETLGFAPKARWLMLLPSDAKEVYLATLLDLALHQLLPVDAELLALASPESSAEYLALRGETPEDALDELGVVAAFARGEIDEACELGIRIAETYTRRKYRQLKGLPGAIHTLCCLATQDQAPERWAYAERACRDASRAKAGFDGAYEAMQAIVDEQRLESSRIHRFVDIKLSYYDLNREPWLVVLIMMLQIGLIDGKTHRNLRSMIMREHSCLQRAKDGGFDALSRELNAALLRIEGSPPEPGTLAARMKLSEPWMTALAELESIADAPTPQAKKAKSEFRPHLRWAIAFSESSQTVDISAYWVKSARSKKGSSVSIATLLKGKDERISNADRAVLDHSGPTGRGRHHPELKRSALVALIGHPYATRADSRPLELVRGTPRVDVTSIDEGTRLTLQPRGLLERDIAFEEVGDTLVVYERSPTMAHVAQAMRGEPLTVPHDGTQRLSTLLAKLAANVEVRAQADVEIGGEDVTSDPRPWVRLDWNGTTLSADVFVAPLGIDGPHTQPGLGARRVAATLEGKAVRALRDLESESTQCDALRTACPRLRAEGPGGHTLLDALMLLMELQDAAELTTLVWPKGKPLKAPTRLNVSNLTLRIGEGSRWLEVNAELAVDEETVLSYRELLDHRGQQLVPIGDGRFAALSDELRARLDALDTITAPKKSAAQASTATLPFLLELGDGAGMLELDKSLRERRADLERALKKTPRLPKAFKATLRDYQREGFVWMSRLAEAGLGACLADDMGLGKTVQSLALLMLRRKKGPALVVAPSSVQFGWVSESARFAPGLRVTRLDQTDDRAAAIAALGPSDILVCSYGLLANEAEALASTSFDTVIFDEAHLLKNAGTKRAKAARGLQAHFRLSLTGTPIENHVGELWSLMQATVPGLLDTASRFKTRFAQPIGEGQVKPLEQLRALVRPFMLRRTKGQVLGELPPRSETTLVVRPSNEERSFYEALRQQAVRQLELAGSKSQVTMLAHLSKLRMAAVDPRLVDPSGPPGAKLEALLERLEALREEGHRVLVFSQFLGSLEHVADALRSAGVSFQSLDGSTSSKERERRIDAFQNGEGEVFIISLKAGGVGLNLTGADYVIHMDPWWNPAVEEQATSRSHRLGQERPVTVYRMVTEGTIEERILEMHEDKRTLAQGLLAGIDKAKKLDIAQIRTLLAAR